MSLLVVGSRRSAVLGRGLRCISCTTNSSCARKVTKRSIPEPLFQQSTVSFRSFRTASCLHAKVTKHFPLADIGEGIAEVVVKEWYVKVGDRVKEFDPICEVQSDKAAATITSRFDGVIESLEYEVDDMAKVGSTLVLIEVEEDIPGTEVQSTPEEEIVSPSTDSESDRVSVLATPAVRRIARENDINLSSVPATGKQGRVLKEDILRFLQGQTGPPQRPSDDTPTLVPTPAPPTPSPSPRPPVASPVLEDRVEDIKGIRSVMVKTMTAANAIPTFGFNDEITMDGLVAVRSQLKGVAADRGIKLSYMPFFVKAASMAMLQYPVLNSSPNSDCTKLTYKAQHNFGVAMDTPSGLVVPNIKSVQEKSILEVAAELQRLITLGAAGKLGPGDMAGGTFSLSNIGAIGGTYARPVLLPPEVLIGALGRMQTVPRFNRKDEVVKARILNISWSADHRVIDGATVARFSNLWKQYLEHPATLLADMR